MQHFCGPVTYVPKALHYNSLAFYSLFQFGLLKEKFILKQLINAEVNPKSCGLLPPLNASLVDKFASSATICVDFLVSKEVCVSVIDPRHYLLVRPHVWPYTINAWTDETFLG